MDAFKHLPTGWQKTIDWSLVRTQVAIAAKRVSASTPKQAPPKTFEEWAMRRHYQRRALEEREDFAHLHDDPNGEFR